MHAGFCSYYRELAGVGMSDDLAGLHGLLGYPVVLTGHSLGAAAAVSQKRQHTEEDGGGGRA